MLKQVRQGLLGLGIEVTPGTPVAATTTVPFITNTLNGKHEALKDIAARGSRAQNFTSVIGKQYGEGEVSVNVDTLNVGFFLKLATGNEALSTIQAGAYAHLFYTTVSGNTPLTATLYNYQGVDTQQFPSMALDSLTFEVKEALATVKGSFKGFFPTSGAFSQATVSGTLLAFNKYSMQLGNTLSAAGQASKSAVTDFMFEIKNNADLIYESGQSIPTRVFWKELVVTGEFSRYFETTVDRDNYLNLNKQSIIVTASGLPLANGASSETLVVNFAKCLYTDTTVDTGGLENFFVVKTKFEAEVDTTQGKQYDITLTNYRSTVYS